MATLPWKGAIYLHIAYKSGQGNVYMYRRLHLCIPKLIRTVTRCRQCFLNCWYKIERETILATYGKKALTRNMRDGQQFGGYSVDSPRG
jgi:hypothetical protein